VAIRADAETREQSKPEPRQEYVVAIRADAETREARMDWENDIK